LFLFPYILVFLRTCVARKLLSSDVLLRSKDCQRLVYWAGTNTSENTHTHKHTAVELTFRGPVSPGKVCTYENTFAHTTQCHNSDDHKVNFHPCEEPIRYTLGRSIQQQVRKNAMLTSLYGHPF